MLKINHDIEYWNDYTDKTEFEELTPKQIKLIVRAALEQFEDEGTNVWDQLDNVIYAANVHYFQGGILDVEVAYAMVSQIVF